MQLRLRHGSLAEWTKFQWEKVQFYTEWFDIIVTPLWEMFEIYVANLFLTYLNINSIVFLCTHKYIYFEKPFIQDGRITLEVLCLIWLNYYLRKSSVTNTLSFLTNLDITRVNLFLNFTSLRDTEANIFFSLTLT